MARELSEYGRVYALLRKRGPFDPQDIQDLRENCEGFTSFPHNLAVWANARFTVEMIESMNSLAGKLGTLDESVNRLNESSTHLVTETNKLTTRILRLTRVAVGLAVIGVVVAGLQVWRAYS